MGLEIKALRRWLQDGGNTFVAKVKFLIVCSHNILIGFFWNFASGFKSMSIKNYSMFVTLMYQSIPFGFTNSR